MSPIRLNSESIWRSIASRSTLLGLFLIGLVWITTMFHLQNERANIERAAVQNSSNLAGAFEEHLSRTLNEIDRSIKIIRANYVRDPNSFDFRNWLRSNQLFDDQTLQVSIVSPDGFIKLSSIDSSSSIGTDLRDREHFRFQANATGDPLFISKPVIGRTTGKWSVQLTRRIEKSDGSFDGMIVVSLDPAYLTRFYSSVNLGGSGYVRVVGDDGIIRAVGGTKSNALGKNLSAGDLFKHFPKDPNGWYYTGSNISDHVPRLVTFRDLKNYPLIITIGLATDEIFSDFYAKRRVYYTVATALSIMILIVVGIGIRGRSIRERMSRERDLQNRRFDAVLRNMPLGVCMFDSQCRLALTNDRYRNMYGVPADLSQVGTRFVDIIRHRKTIGTLDGDPDEFCAEFAKKLSAGSLLKIFVQLKDGRIVSVVNQPIDGGGWISIHEDTTEQQLAKENLEQTKRFLDTIIESVPISIVVKDASSGKYILVNQAFEAFFGWSRERLIGRTVYDLFPAEVAERIVRCDGEAIRLKSKQVNVDASVETPENGTRIVTTTRSVVSDAADRPQYVITVIEDTTEKKKANAKIAYMAHHDPLTGLPNRTQLTERIEEVLADARRGKTLAVHFLDLDHFKFVNDTLGHLVGDELLREVAERLRACVRDVDTVARLGGDEFAVVQTSVEDPEDMFALAERIRAALKAPYDLGGLRAVIDVSIGISQAPRDGTSPVELLKRADLALYKAKEDGRSTVRVFEADMDTRMRARRTLETELRNAIVNNEFRLFYEPIVNIRDNEIDCVEGLLRWFHPRRGIVPPAEFIAAAEETGLIIPLGEWVIRQACAEAANWPEHVKVAVNLSPTQLSSENLADMILDVLKKTGVAPERLELEITEATLLKHNQANLTVLHNLRSHGVRIVMDDFGTGYSSLNYLRRFAFDKIKIDRSFVADLSVDNELSLAIIQSVARMAGVLNVSVTAEGVETNEQLELIKAAGCTHFQGFINGRSRPAEDITRLFLRRVEKASTAA